MRITPEVDDVPFAGPGSKLFRCRVVVRVAEVAGAELVSLS